MANVSREHETGTQLVLTRPGGKMSRQGNVGYSARCVAKVARRGTTPETSCVPVSTL